VTFSTPTPGYINYPQSRHLVHPAGFGDEAHRSQSQGFLGVSGFKLSDYCYYCGLVLERLQAVGF
jgi:hypothetical protein